MLLAFMVFFEFGIGPLLWTYLPECLPPHAINLGASLNWAAFICISLITKPLINTGLGISGTFMIYASCCFIIGIYCSVCLIESMRWNEFLVSSNQCQSQSWLFLATLLPFLTVPLRPRPPSFDAPASPTHAHSSQVATNTKPQSSK